MCLLSCVQLKCVGLCIRSVSPATKGVAPSSCEEVEQQRCFLTALIYSNLRGFSWLLLTFMAQRMNYQAWLNVISRKTHTQTEILRLINTI